jgi:hypothetical protein
VHTDILDALGTVDGRVLCGGEAHQMLRVDAESDAALVVEVWRWIADEDLVHQPVSLIAL